MDNSVSPTSQDDNANVDLLRETYRRVNNLKKTEVHRFQDYGITDHKYYLMYKSQNGVCASCGQSETVTRGGNVRMLSVDHSHSTGTVRELLCSNCNAALGLLNEDPERIKALAKYAEKWQGK